MGERRYISFDPRAGCGYNRNKGSLLGSACQDMGITPKLRGRSHMTSSNFGHFYPPPLVNIHHHLKTPLISDVDFLPDVAWPAARSAALWAFCRRQNAPEGLNMRQ